MGKAEDTAVPIHVWRQDPRHVVERELLGLEGNRRHTAAKSPADEAPVKGAFTDQFALRAWACSEAEDLDGIARTGHLQSIE